MTLKKCGIIGILFASCTICTTAHGQVPTIDYTSIAKAVETLKTIQQDVQTGMAIYQNGKDTINTLGHMGPLTLQNYQRYAQLLNVDQMAQNTIATYGINPNYYNITNNLAQTAGTTALNPNNFSANSGNYSNALQNVQNFFYMQNTNNQSIMSAEQRDKIMALRQSNLRNTATQSYTTAMTQRSSAQNAEQNVQNLQTLVGEAQDMRGDIHANSMVEIAHYQQNEQILGLLAQELQLEASRDIANDGSVTGN